MLFCARVTQSHTHVCVCPLLFCFSFLVKGGGGGGGGRGHPIAREHVLVSCQTHSDYGPSKRPLKLTLLTSRIHCHRLPLSKKVRIVSKFSQGT